MRGSRGGGKLMERDKLLEAVRCPDNLAQKSSATSLSGRCWKRVKAMIGDRCTGGVSQKAVQRCDSSLSNQRWIFFCRRLAVRRFSIDFVRRHLRSARRRTVRSRSNSTSNSTALKCPNFQGAQSDSSKDCPKIRKECSVLKQMVRDSSTHKEAAETVRRRRRRHRRSSRGTAPATKGF